LFAKSIRIIIIVIFYFQKTNSYSQQ